jgi:transglutaminase-like putative cysteine protease
MARARGLPARVVSGLAVFQDGSHFHAWTEIWQGGWNAADPTFGHVPASASLVRLSLGGGDRGIRQVLVAASARFLPLRSPR